MGLPISRLIQDMIDELEEAKTDAEKFDKGNSAAGVRVRKALMKLKTDAHNYRGVIQKRKNAR